MLLNMGERIRELRRERALTQDEVARRLNISAQAVSKWENAVSYPDLEMIPPLAELLGVSIDALFREDAQSEAEDCCRRADELLLTPARAKEALPMLREAVIRRPFHAGLLGRLGTALYLAYRLPENLGQTEINEQGEETVVTHGDPALLREADARRTHFSKYGLAYQLYIRHESGRKERNDEKCSPVSLLMGA